MELLQPILDRVVQVWERLSKDDREDFRSLLQSFIRLYGFISQVISFEDVELEYLYVFARNLNRKLPKRKERLPTEVQDAVDLDSFRVQQTFRGTIDLEDEDGTVPVITAGTHHATEDEKDLLSNIVQTLNDTYGTDLTEEDKVDIESIQRKLNADEELQAVVNANNTRENIKIKFDSVVDSLILKFVHNKLGLYKKLSEPKVNTMFKNKWFEGFYRENVAGSDQPRV